MVNKEKYDFSCWVIKYGRVSINEKTYQKDSLKNSDDTIVPLCWNHDHYRPDSVLGNVLLENRDEGIYAYCALHDISIKEDVIRILQDRGSVSLSPFINKVKIEGNYITSGIIREVSLVLARVDPDEAYYPIMREEEHG